MGSGDLRLMDMTTPGIPQGPVLKAGTGWGKPQQSVDTRGRRPLPKDGRVERPPRNYRYKSESICSRY